MLSISVKGFGCLTLIYGHQSFLNSFRAVQFVFSTQLALLLNPFLLSLPSLLSLSFPSIFLFSTIYLFFTIFPFPSLLSFPFPSFKLPPSHPARVKSAFCGKASKTLLPSSGSLRVQPWNRMAYFIDLAGCLLPTPPPATTTRRSFRSA